MQFTGPFCFSLVCGLCRPLQADVLCRGLDPMASRDPFYPNYFVTHPASQIQILKVSTNQNSSLSLKFEVLLTCPT